MIFSVITINLNNAAGLKLTIESVIQQSFQSFEYIIIDGGSTDGSVKEIQSYEDSIDYWISEEDTGIYNAMNKGIKRAKGDYCFFLNSGDRFTNSEILKEISQNLNGQDFIYGNLIITRKNRIIQRIINNPDATFIDIYAGVLKHQATFIKNRLFDIYGLYDEKLKIIGDWDFYLKTIGINNCSYSHIDIFISYYEFGGLSTCSDEMKESVFNERKYVREKYFSPTVAAEFERIKRYKDFFELFNYRGFMFFLKIMKKIYKLIYKRY